MKLTRTFIGTLTCLAFSAPSLANDASATKTYVVNLSKTIEPAISVALVDGLGTEMPSTKSFELVHDTTGDRDLLLAKAFADDLNIVSNEAESARYKITRTLSPLSLNGSEADAQSVLFWNQLITIPTGCNELFPYTFTRTTKQNQTMALTSSVPNNGKICDTSVEFKFKDKAPAGNYAANLTIDIEPSL
ncbi:hypothetical protein [Vibrio diabolicus]|uniref:hypothetical protein n=1 Tax=Vibrio diabolicus TaxID=50719 RepID=UPI001428581F|nr:hypothetical protein [Vibrio diabolicus]QIR98765.1 hypothetical protein FR741_13890 [Vibrio diabolicus]